MRFSLLLVVALPSLALARFTAVGGTAPASPLDASVLEDSSTAITPPAPTLRQKLGLYLLESQAPWDVSLQGGTQMLRVRSDNVIAPAVGLRLTRPAATLPPDVWGEGRGEAPWSLEVGAVIPQNTPGNLESISEVINNSIYTSRVNSIYEVHITANYTLPHGNQSWAAPDAGFGVSMLHVTDQIDTVPIFNGTPQTYDPGNYSFSPLFRIGLTLFPEHLLSIRLDAAYVGYGNTVTSAGQTFDLGISGLMAREMLQMRL